MSWASRRRAKYIGGFLVIVMIIVIIVAAQALYERPTCFDGEHNGNEAGIDCGGSCVRICSFQASAPVVLWSRFFEVTPGIYNAVAMIENPNTGTQASNVPYTFRLRDTDNILITEIPGSIDIPPQREVPLFFSGIVTGSREPARSFFELGNVSEWKRVTEEYLTVRVTDPVLTDASSSPRLDATVVNDAIVPVHDVTFVAILSDIDGNAVAASQTLLGSVASQSRVPIVFTWPQPLTHDVATIDVIPVIPFVE